MLGTGTLVLGTGALVLGTGVAWACEMDDASSEIGGVREGQEAGGKELLSQII